MSRHHYHPRQSTKTTVNKDKTNTSNDQVGIKLESPRDTTQSFVGADLVDKVVIQPLTRLAGGVHQPSLGIQFDAAVPRGCDDCELGIGATGDGVVAQHARPGDGGGATVWGLREEVVHCHGSSCGSKGKAGDDKCQVTVLHLCCQTFQGRTCLLLEISNSVLQVSEQ